MTRVSRAGCRAATRSPACAVCAAAGAALCACGAAPGAGRPPTLPAAAAHAARSRHSVARRTPYRAPAHSAFTPRSRAARDTRPRYPPHDRRAPTHSAVQSSPDRRRTERKGRPQGGHGPYEPAQAPPA
ncbi:hypothetical protein RR46_04809 [Papilio xuthus]|uniref:Uncharacterized protein n=1 Tax=Papilio xuthus TaxID=66420 RepID=A0A194Q8T8_PAPXU|nr:hypothetical protein RR46_04809 [Papilio xuthus]